MFTRISIEGFRTFSEFTLADLTRVNLLVGPNGTGKTTLLEAVELLGRDTPAGLWWSPRRRGERLRALLPEAPRGCPDFSNLFRGHRLVPGASFRLAAEGPTPRALTVVVRSDGGSHARLDPTLDRPDLPTHDLDIRCDRASAPIVAAFALPHGWTLPASAPALMDALSVQFLGAVQPVPLAERWDKLAATPAEDDVLDVLRLVEPRVERLVFISDANGQGDVDGRSPYVKLEGLDTRVPLATLGDGLKRLLTLGLHLVAARDGLLLVDDVDSGLHYSAMAGMWRLVAQTALRLNIQVFATTHSLDCVRALADLDARHPDLAPEISLHRIDRAARAATRFTAGEVTVATQHHLELR